MSDYILTSDGELYHHGVKGMRWGRRKDSEEPTIGQNYTTPSEFSGGGGGGEPEEEVAEDDLDMRELTNKADRFIETAKVWINDKLSLNVIDTISGKAQPMSWKQAKSWVDYTYRFADTHDR